MPRPGTHRWTGITFGGTKEGWFDVEGHFGQGATPCPGSSYLVSGREYVGVTETDKHYLTLQYTYVHYTHDINS